MGTDIYGFIECRRGYSADGGPAPVWQPAIELGHLYDTRDYDAFGSLFGVRNHHGAFEPLAPGRGLPEDASETVAREHLGHGTTWISWAELAAADWDEATAEPDTYLHRYRRRSPGDAWVFEERAFPVDRLAELSGLTPPGGGHGWPAGTEWEDGDVLLRIEPLTRRQTVHTATWAPVLTVMRVLAELHGGTCVRLSVWFD
ncbi:hypothetical protein [Streptomyces sp. NPDC057287]|uniref:hypothetical protein n=1 Tax=Streptomyces sp. NPDC057287 TaxID=3346086 RepID=UPI003635DCC2